VTVEEVATLAKSFGWSYETLMAMPGAERRLWLAAAARTSSTPRPASSSASSPVPPGASPVPAGPRMLTDAERKARLLELHEELNHRGRKR
jgi:hypothetical protein